MAGALMQFDEAYLKGVKSDLAKGKITITIEMSNDAENSDTAQYLADTYTVKEKGDNAMPLRVNFAPKQVPLFDKATLDQAKQ